MLTNIEFKSPNEAVLTYDHREPLTVRCSDGGVSALVAELLSPLVSRVGAQDVNWTPHEAFLAHGRSLEDTVVVRDNVKALNCQSSST